MKIGFPFKFVIRRSKDEHVITIDRTEFEICHPKEVGEWTWRGMKTRKFIVHVKKDGKIDISDLVLPKGRQKTKKK